MKNYSFTFTISCTLLHEELAEAIYGAGCDDSCVASRCGVHTVSFDREAESLEDALCSAIRDCHQIAGVRVVSIEYE